MKYPIKTLSFPDYDVKSMFIDHSSSLAKFDLDGAWLDGYGSIKGGEFVIFNWESCYQRRYTSDKSWMDIPFGQEEPLKDILELLVEVDLITVRGFGAVTGDWLELVANAAQGEYRTDD